MRQLLRTRVAQFYQCMENEIVEIEIGTKLNWINKYFALSTIKIERELIQLEIYRVYKWKWKEHNHNNEILHNASSHVHTRKSWPPGSNEGKRSST